MNAISTVILSLVKSGDHIVVSRNIYGGSYELFNTVVNDFGIEVSWVDDISIESYRSNIKSNTVLLYGEFINNPTLKILDIKAFADLAKEKGLLTVIDNTFASPYLLRPIEYGIDVVVHSATSKYNG